MYYRLSLGILAIVVALSALPQSAVAQGDQHGGSSPSATVIAPIATATDEALSQCYDCVRDGIAGWVCKPIQAGTSQGPGYHLCHDGGAVVCEMSEGCSPTFALTARNVRPDGAVTAKLGAITETTKAGRRFVLACEGKVIGRHYNADAGMGVRSSLSVLTL